MVCDTETPGPVIAIALFAVDDCFNPIYGADTGFLDDCATVGAVEPQDAESRPEFAKYCPNGDVRAFVPARTVTKTTEVTFRFPKLPDEFLVAVGAADPVMFNGELVGINDCGNRVSMLALVWQERLGGDACSGEDPGAPAFVTPYALRDVRFTQDGTVGTSDFDYLIVGSTQRANIGSGPIPLFYDGTDVPAWNDECLTVCVSPKPWRAALPPDECGLLTTVEPETPCTTGS